MLDAKAWFVVRILSAYILVDSTAILVKTTYACMSSPQTNIPISSESIHPVDLCVYFIVSISTICESATSYTFTSHC